MNWNTPKLITAGSLGVLYVVLALFGAGLQAVLGFPLASGIINIFTSAAILAFCCLLLNQFWSATIMMFVYGVIALPLPVMGTPGFLPKILIGISVGIVVDGIYIFLKPKEKIASLVIGAVSQVVMAIEILGLGMLFSIPGIEKALEIFLTPLVIIATIICGAIGGYIGYFIFNKLRNTAVVLKIQGK